jgi:UDP-N-acetylglucosamine transferase subunit ALG13
MVDLLHTFGLLNYSFLHQIKYPNLSTNWKFLDCKEKPLLLFSCLDWGLGHTTRSVPLIKEFLNLGCELIVACNSTQKAVLQPEFPHIRFVELEGYGLTYAKTAFLTRFKILLQLSKILIAIKRETRWVDSFLAQNQVDALISDNRYGFYHPKLPSVIITHQLGIHSGYGRLADKISKFFIYKLISRFTRCWVPDYEKVNALAGILSHPANLPAIPVQYIGPLSRFDSCDALLQNQIDVLVILSGPEPQRSIAEKLMLKQAAAISNKKIALVRGVPLNSSVISSSAISVFNHLEAVRLNELICASDIVVCRSGYTTIMDMMKLKKKMIVIPTPGQPEQEYLARYLAANKFALCVTQDQFDLESALQKAASFTFQHVDANMNEYKVVLKDFVSMINSLSPSSTC